MNTCRNSRGITLVALLIVVIVIGLVVILGYNTWVDFLAKREAKSVLQEIFKAEMAYYVEHNCTYTTSLEKLGIQIPEFQRCEYTIMLGHDTATSKPTFVVRATHESTQRCWTIDDQNRRKSITSS